MRQIRDKPGTVKQDCAAGPNRLQVCRPYEGGGMSVTGVTCSTSEVISRWGAAAVCLLLPGNEMAAPGREVE